MGLLTFKSLCSNKLTYPCWSFRYPSEFPKSRRAKNSRIRALASRKSVKRLRIRKNVEKGLTQQPSTISPEERDEVEQASLHEFESAAHENKESSVKNAETKKDYVTIASRGTVLQACTTTSGLISALGFLIRQASHIASVEGLSVVDCSEISFNFETWHLQLIAGLVVLISSCRYLLLNTWPDFAESSEAANQQVLSSLRPLDYIVVAFLPTISEEVLFRGALLPLFGINWRSAILVGALFGILHLGSGRKYSFAIWAAFVGFAYGYATILSSSLLVPMASHAANNLVGGVLWRFSSKPQK